MLPTLTRHPRVELVAAADPRAEARPRRPEELVTARGGGVMFSQAAHQVDIVRLLAGGRVSLVRALTGSWDSRRPTEGAYAALLAFEDGACASLAYSGYGHFDTDEF